MTPSQERVRVMRNQLRNAINAAAKGNLSDHDVDVMVDACLKVQEDVYDIVNKNLTVFGPLYESPLAPIFHSVFTASLSEFVGKQLAASAESLLSEFSATVAQLRAAGDGSAVRMEDVIASLLKKG